MTNAVIECILSRSAADAEAVHREFGLAENEVPVMLLSVGPERPGNWAQKPRLPVADVLELA
jgi:nitroreductase